MTITATIIKPLQQNYPRNNCNIPCNFVNDTMMMGSNPQEDNDHHVPLPIAMGNTTSTTSDVVEEDGHDGHDHQDDDDDDEYESSQLLSLLPGSSSAASPSNRHNQPSTTGAYRSVSSSSYGIRICFKTKSSACVSLAAAAGILALYAG